jgi:acyl-CoA synthetase (AMP-forming)/AMP-acid ligase II
VATIVCHLGALEDGRDGMRLVEPQVPSSASVGGRIVNLTAHFDNAVGNDPERVCVLDGRTGRTYAEVQRDSYRIAHVVKGMGIDAGAKIAMLSDNSVLSFECIIGILRAGCVWMPIGPNQAVEDIVALVANSRAELLLYTHEHTRAASEIVHCCGSLRSAVTIDGSDRYAPSLSAMMVSVSDTDPQIHRDSDDLATLINSGGTTGRPKGVMMTHRCWETFIAGLMLRYHGIRPVHLICSPIMHTAGGAALAFSALGATTVLLDRFHPERIMTAIERHGVTHLFLPPAAVRLLIKHPDIGNHDYSSLRFFIFGGAPMPMDTLKEAVEIFGPVMTTAFGQTETGGDVTFFGPDEIMDAVARGDEERLRSCGRATVFMRVEIMGKEGRLLPHGEIGEIVVRSDQVMKGYYNDSAETANASRSGWHHTGDLGYRDSDGYFYVVDRKRDVILTGGFNVFPSAVERVLRQHPAVRDCAVVGIPDGDWGEVPVAVLETQEHAVVDVDELASLCAQQLSPLQRPRSIEVWSELPRGHGGKISRRFVRDRLMGIA